MAVLALVATIAGAAMSAVGSIQQGNAAAAQAQAQAQTDAMNYRSRSEAARYNEILDRQQGSQELQAAAMEEGSQRRAARRAIATQAAAGASTGLELTGSSALSLENSAAEAELDALNIRYAGGARARSAYAGAELQGYEGRVARWNEDMAIKSGKAKAKAARTSGYIGAASGLLSSIGSAAGSYGKK